MPNAVALAFCLVLLSVPAIADQPPAAPARAEVQTSESQAAMTPAAAIERLKAGNARFVANTMKQRDWSTKVMATASAQYPFAIVLGCMDSRGPVEIIFDQGIGDLFVLRVAGNVVNSDELGSLEYALHVGTKLIVVLGHTSCGAVKGSLEGVELGNLTGLLAQIHPAVKEAGCTAKEAGCVDRVAEKNVRNSMKEIRTRSPYVAKALDEGKVGLVGAMYDLATGKVTFLEK
jgi:carbonic anhydrase